MIAVETVIRKLVSEYEFVIIPGFGALLSHQIPANYDNDSGTFAPLVKKLAFNEFLKLDDGLLANFISREEKISHIDAVTHVKRYIDVLRSTLQIEGETSIAGIGEFKTNTEGKLIFEPNTENHFKDEWYGFNKITAKTFEKRNVLTSVIADSHATGEDVEVLELNSAKTINLNWVRWASAAMLAGFIFYVSFFLVNSNTDNKSTLNPFDNLFGGAKANRSKEIVIAPVKRIEKRKASAVTTSVKPDSLVLPIKLTPVVISNPATIAPLISSEKKFYLIAGAFKGTKQAKVLLKQLQDKGYDKAIIITPSRYSTKVKVAVGAYGLEKEAYQASAQLKGVIGEAGWVFKIR